jgi:hypothetical protein
LHRQQLLLQSQLLPQIQPWSSRKCHTQTFLKRPFHLDPYLGPCPKQQLPPQQ